MHKNTNQTTKLDEQTDKQTHAHITRIHMIIWMLMKEIKIDIEREIENKSQVLFLFSTHC